MLQHARVIHLPRVLVEVEQLALQRPVLVVPVVPADKLRVLRIAQRRARGSRRVEDPESAERVVVRVLKVLVAATQPRYATALRCNVL